MCIRDRINVDLPWNPTRLEQRIGRIKRFGQRRETVDMLNLVFEQTVDEKIYERLYLGGAKGGTVYVDGSRDSQVLTLKAEENVWDEEGKLEEEKEHVKINKDKTFLVDSIANLEATDVTIGNEIGDTCPICRQGTVEDLGGCNTCTNCGAQLKCGL